MYWPQAASLVCAVREWVLPLGQESQPPGPVVSLNSPLPHGIHVPLSVYPISHTAAQKQYRINTPHNRNIQVTGTQSSQIQSSRVTSDHRLVVTFSWPWLWFELYVWPWPHKRITSRNKQIIIFCTWKKKKLQTAVWVSYVLLQFPLIPEPGAELVLPVGQFWQKVWGLSVPSLYVPWAQFVHAIPLWYIPGSQAEDKISIQYWYPNPNPHSTSF